MRFIIDRREFYIMDDKELSYGRCKTMKSFNELYDGLKTLK